MDSVGRPSGMDFGWMIWWSEILYRSAGLDLFLDLGNERFLGFETVHLSQKLIRFQCFSAAVLVISLFFLGAHLGVVQLPAKSAQLHSLWRARLVMAGTFGVVKLLAQSKRPTFTTFGRRVKVANYCRFFRIC